MLGVQVTLENIQVRAGRHNKQVVEGRGVDKLVSAPIKHGKRYRLLKVVGNGILELARRPTQQVVGGITLGIKIDNQCSFAPGGTDRGQVTGDTGLADATFLVCDLTGFVCDLADNFLVCDLTGFVCDLADDNILAGDLTEDLDLCDKLSPASF